MKEKGTAALGFVGDCGSQAMGFLKEKGSGALNFIKEKGTAALTFVKEKGAAVVSFAQEKGTAALTYMGNKANQILDVIQDPLGAAKDALSTAWDAAKTGWSKAQSAMGPLWEATKQRVAQAGSALNETVLQPAIAFAKEKGQQAMAYMKERFPGLANCFEVAIDLAGRATAFVSEKMEQAGAWVSKHYDKISMAGHLLLDGLGMVPGFGAIADGLNAVWYLAEGNYTDAAMSALAAIPAVGDAAAAAKMAKKAATVGDVVKAVDKVDDVAGGVKTALKAADAASDAKQASGTITKAIEATTQVRSNVDKVIPRRVQTVLAKRQDEIQAGAEFTSSTVSDVQQAMEENGGELKPGQLGEILSGNVKSAAVGYAADKVIGNAVENVAGGVVDRVKKRRGGGVEAPDAPRSAAPARTQVEAHSTPATTQGDASRTRTLPTEGEASSGSRSSAKEIAQQHPELEAGLKRDSAARRVIEKNPEAADVLSETAPKNLTELSDAELATELDIAEQIGSKPSSKAGVKNETHLINGHEWTEKGDGWFCRASDNPMCTQLTFSGGKPTVKGDPYSPEAVDQRIEEGRDYYANTYGVSSAHLDLDEPRTFYGKQHTEVAEQLEPQGFKQGEYGGTSEAYTYNRGSKKDGTREEVVVNYGGGIHNREQIFDTPYYYKIEGGNRPKTKVVNSDRYPAREWRNQTGWRIVEAKTGEILKDVGQKVDEFGNIIDAKTKAIIRSVE